MKKDYHTAQSSVGDCKSVYVGVHHSHWIVKLFKQVTVI